MKKYSLRVKDVTGQVHETEAFPEAVLESEMLGNNFGTGIFSGVKPESVAEAMEILAKMAVGTLPDDVPVNEVKGFTLHIDGRDRFFRIGTIVWAEVVVTDDAK